MPIIYYMGLAVSWTAAIVIAVAVVLDYWDDRS